MNIVSRVVLSVFTLFFSFGFQAQAKITHFQCLTAKGMDDGIRRTVEFKLNIPESGEVTIFGPQGKQFKISPPSEALKALNTYDNGGVYVADENRIQIGADDIGMLHVDLILWRKSDLKTGYVSTSGESNEKLYSPIACDVN